MGISIKLLLSPLGNLIGNKAVFLLIPFGGIVYIGALFLTKTITKEMIHMVRPKKLAPDMLESNEGEI